MKFGVIFVILLLSTLGWANFFNNLFEGDIAFRDEVLGDGGSQNAFMRHSSKTWAYNTVPYYIDETSIRSKEDRDFIKEVIQDIQDSAKCIIFEDISDREEKTGDHIRFTAHGDAQNPGNGCWSYVGKQGGEQVVNIAEECMDWGKIAHEVLHALGQVHEHNRPDRDEYIDINQTNIDPGKKKNFIKRKKGRGTDEVVYIDAKYDLYSLLHYPSTAWSKDKTSETTTPINKHYDDIGGTNGMTATDIIELNLRYGCTEIAIPIVIDYMHEVENRLEKQDFHMEDKFEQRLNDMQETMKLKLEEKLAAEKLNTGIEIKNLEAKMEEKFEERLKAEKKDTNKRLNAQIKTLEEKKRMLHVDPQCSQPYTILADKWRKIEYGVKHPTSHCDREGSGSLKTQLIPGWYAFKFGSDYTTIPTTPPAEQYRQPKNTCGAVVSAWIEGSHPTIGQPQKYVNIYFAYSTVEKWKGQSVSAKVVGCVSEDGQPMYLYYLHAVPECDYAYCAM